MVSRHKSADRASDAGDSDWLGSYTTARVSAGRVERVERHARRLCRDAERLGLPRPSRLEIETLLLATAKQSFGRGSGIVRVEWSSAKGSAPELRAIPRDLGEDRRFWRARRADTLHPGAENRRNTKSVAVDAYDQARREPLAHHVDEVLLCDAKGLLVEGSSSNILIVDDAGRMLTPAQSLGGVEGLGLTIVRENRPEIREAEVGLDVLYTARELMGVNAVRGVVPIIELDGKPIGASPEAGPWAQRLRRIFFRD